MAEDAPGQIKSTSQKLSRAHRHGALLNFQEETLETKPAQKETFDIGPTARETIDIALIFLLVLMKFKMNDNFTAEKRAISTKDMKNRSADETNPTDRATSAQ